MRQPGCYCLGCQHVGLLMTLLVDVVGGTIANLVGTGDIWELNVFDFIVAVIASIGLLAVADRAGLGSAERERLER